MLCNKVTKQASVTPIPSLCDYRGIDMTGRNSYPSYSKGGADLMHAYCVESRAKGGIRDTKSLFMKN